MSYLNKILIFTITLFGYVSSQTCPSHWYGYSAQSKCYRFSNTNTMAWQDARGFCQIHGGDLLRIDTLAERNFIIREIAKVMNHTHRPMTYWTGLTAQGFTTQWGWADGTAAGGFINWARGAPHASTSGAQRCAKLANGKFNDDDCSHRLPFICYRNRGIPLNCDSDHGYQTLNGACYKVRTDKKNWNAAVRACNHDGATIVTIDNQQDEVAMHDFAVNNHQPFWIGLQAQNGTNLAVNWTWWNGTTLSTAYWHGQPHVSRGKCVILSNSNPVMHDWNTAPCGQAKSFVCRKPEGVCMPGWIGHRKQCYQFDVHYRLNYGAASRYCQQQGAQLLKIDSATTQQFLNSYIPLMKDSGVRKFWIGASDNNHAGTNAFKWRDGSTIGTGNARFQHWAGTSHRPTNTANRQDCGYMDTGDRSGSWRTTVSCQSAWSFVCTIPMGRTVQRIPSTPRPVYACPGGWRQRGPNCFKIGAGTTDWSTARQTCQRTPGADLAKINSANLQGFINGITQRTIQYWIGLNDRAADGTYAWVSDASMLGGGYKNWKRGQPNNYNHQQNCVALDNRQWNDYECNQRKRFICEKVADSIFPSTPPTTPATDWTVKCGVGWQSNPVTDYCYRFVDEPLTWLDALNECHLYHGNLVAVESSQEQNYIAGIVQSLNSIALWTGANDRGTEGGWRWASGKPFAFLNWAPGQPGTGNKGNGTDCVAMFTQTALWDDIDCNTRNGYICEKRGNVKRTPAPRTTTIKVPAGMVLGCQPGWLPFRYSCYKVIRQPQTWSNAQTVCGRNGAKLASIQDRNENNFIQGNLPKPHLSWDGFWIGLNDLAVENTFQWSDGSTVAFTYWNTLEPNNWGNRNEDCVEMRLASSKWNDEVCSMVRPGFICKAPKRPVSATQAPYQIGCPLYTKGHGPYCYKVVNYGAPLTFDNANAYCNRTFKGTLAVVNDRITQAFIAANMVWMSGYFWIGLSDEVTTGTYKWINGDSIQYTNWYSTHTGNEQSTCVAMRADTPTGLWENLACSQTKHFVCQIPRQGYTLPPVTTPFPNVPCPTGWLTNNGHCLKGFTQKLTWMEARAYCQGFGGDLPSFHQNENDSIIQQLPSNVISAGVWIGLNDRDNENGHIWSDGSAVDYTNWNGNEPNDYNHAEDCVQWIKYSKKWNDVNCYSSQPFICSIARGTQLSAVTTVPTAVQSNLCGTDQNWIFYKNNCYRLSDVTGPNSSLTWYNAQTYCNSLGANLASVHTQDENNLLYGYFTKRSISMFWLGLNNLGNNGISWIDGTPLDFTYYSPGEPNDYFGSEKCIGLIRSALWNDVHCAQQNGYVCKRPSSGAAVIASPTPFPPGGCANGFKPAPGGRNKCFYIGGRLPSMRLNWTAAYQFCRRFGNGYDIASIEDTFEQQYVISMTQGWRNSFWIGLNDRLSNNRFFWQDQTPVFYTNWDRGEPTSQHQAGNQKNVQNCVLMRMYKGHEGRWTDTDCSQRMGYVCQAKQDPNLLVITPPNSCTKAGYQQFRQSCYRPSVPGDMKTWNDAQYVCQNDGGNLVSISDIFESAFVGNLVHRNYMYWIGMSDTKVPGLYGWVDGWPVVYTNWGWRQPSYRSNGNGCVMANKNGRWNDTDCTTKHQYVCEISGAPPPTTPAQIGKCADPSWTADGDYCYAAFVNKGQSWPEANYLCQKAGMEMVSIHSQAELNFVMALVSQAHLTDSTFQPNVWLGMSQGGQGSYTWTDGTAVNFVTWQVGQPTKLGANGQVEECVDFDRKTGRWDDLDCFSQRAYVCKTYKMTSTPPPQQVLNPGVSNNLPHNDNLHTYKMQTGQVGGRTGNGITQLPGITHNNVLSNGGKTQAQSGNNVQTSTTLLGLSTGGIAGVVIACLIVLILVAVGIIILKRRGIVTPPPIKDTGESVGFENALYTKGDDNIRLDGDTDA